MSASCGVQCSAIAMQRPVAGAAHHGWALVLTAPASGQECVCARARLRVCTQENAQGCGAGGRAGRLRTGPAHTERARARSGGGKIMLISLGGAKRWY